MVNAVLAATVTFAALATSAAGLVGVEDAQNPGTATLFAELDAKLKAMGQALQPFVPPQELKSENGELSVNVTVDSGRVRAAGVSFNSRLYNGQFPGPTIRIRAGDTFRLKLTNKLEPNIDEVSYMGHSSTYLVIRFVPD